jgi:hypothetical protein
MKANRKNGVVAQTQEEFSNHYTEGRSRSCAPQDFTGFVIFSIILGWRLDQHT